MVYIPTSLNRPRRMLWRKIRKWGVQKYGVMQSKRQRRGWVTCVGLVTRSNVRGVWRMAGNACYQRNWNDILSSEALDAEYAMDTGEMRTYNGSNHARPVMINAYRFNTRSSRRVEVPLRSEKLVHKSKSNKLFLFWTVQKCSWGHKCRYLIQCYSNHQLTLADVVMPVWFFSWTWWSVL